MSRPVLELENLEVRHGAVQAVRGLSLTVDRGEIVGVVFAALQESRDRGIAILLVEQRAQRTVALADRSHVLSNGALRLTLGPEAANDSATLVSAYFA